VIYFEDPGDFQIMGNNDNYSVDSSPDAN